MKLKNIVYMVLFLPLSLFCASNNKEIRKFEFWNKTKNSVWINYGSKQDPDNRELENWVPTHVGLSRVKTKERITSGIPQDLLLLSYRSEPKNADDVRLYRFAIGNPWEEQKDVFIRVKDYKEELTQFGPQTGPWLGLRGKSDSGFSLRDNITKHDIIPMYYNALQFKDPVFNAVSEKDSQEFNKLALQNKNKIKFANKKLQHDNWTILHQAVLRPQKDILIALMNMGANPNQPDTNGLTPYVLAQLLFKHEPEENVNNRVQYIAIQKLFELFMAQPEKDTLKNKIQNWTNKTWHESEEKIDWSDIAGM